MRCSPSSSGPSRFPCDEDDLAGSSAWEWRSWCRRLLSLVLFVTESVWPLVLVLDAAVAMVALIDLFTLAGSGRLRVERHVGRVCSLDEPEDVELVVENPGRVARSMRLRDDVPDEFSAEPAAFEVCRAGPAAGHSRLPIRAQEARHLCLRAGRCRSWPAAWDSGGASIAGRSAPRFGFIPTFTRSRGSRCWRGATG